MSEDDLLPTLAAWSATVRRELGIEQEVDAATIGVLLKIASVAAHEVVRPAAPLTTYLVGLAMAADPALTAEAAFERVRDLADGWDAQAG